MSNISISILFSTTCLAVKPLPFRRGYVEEIITWKILVAPFWFSYKDINGRATGGVVYWTKLHFIDEYAEFPHTNMTFFITPLLLFFRDFLFLKHQVENSITALSANSIFVSIWISSLIVVKFFSHLNLLQKYAVFSAHSDPFIGLKLV